MNRNGFSVAATRTGGTSYLKNSIEYLDSHVSGGTVAAKNGNLAIMVGGEETYFIRPRRFFIRWVDQF